MRAADTLMICMGRNVHQMRFAGRPLRILVAHPNLDPVLDKLVEVIQLCISLGDPEFLFLVGREPDDGFLQIGTGGLHYEGTNLDHCALPEGRRIAAMRLAPMDTLSFTIT